MSSPSFDEPLIRLVDARVRFVVIGGLALGSWGVVRGTRDCDIVPDPEPDSVFVITAYDLTGKGLAAFRRRRRKKQQ